MKKLKLKITSRVFLHDGEWELTLADEFDGIELDETEWDYRTCMKGTKE